MLFNDLQHPHVVKYIDFEFAFDSKSSTFNVHLILEYYPGGDLCQFIGNVLICKILVVRCECSQAQANTAIMNVQSRIRRGESRLRNTLYLK